MRLVVRPRALAVAFGILVVLDLVLRIPLSLPLPDYFRTPNRTLMGYGQLVDSMAREDGVRLAVVGDSVAQGGFAEKDQTLSAWLDRDYAGRGRDVHGYNLALIGAHANDMLPVVAELSERHAADVILLNFDYRFYRGGSVARRYPELYQRVTDWSGVRDASLLATGTPVRRPSFQTRADSAVGSVWRLYGLRDYAIAAAFGDTPPNALAHSVRVARYRMLDRPMYAKKPASKLDLKGLRDAYHVPKLTEDNIDIRYLVALLDVARRAGVPVVVWVGPVDEQLLDEYGIWDRAGYARDMAFTRQLVERHGATFLDLTTAVPREHIADSHHPLSAGYRDIAEDVTAFIEPTVREVERRRADTGGR